MELQDQIDRLEGKLMAAEAILVVLLASYPDPRKMAEALTLAIEGLIGISTPTSLSDQVLAGQLATIEKLRPVIAAMEQLAASKPRT